MRQFHRNIAIVTIASLVVVLLAVATAFAIGALERTRRFSQPDRLDLLVEGAQPGDHLLRALLENIEREAVVRKGSGILMLTFERQENTSPMASIGESIPVSTDASSMTVADPSSIVSMLKERLPLSASLPIGALLKTESRSVFGAAISLPFDFLPLFQGRSTFFLAQTGLPTEAPGGAQVGSGRAWGFEGTRKRDEDDLSEKLMTFHTSRSEAIPPTVESTTLPSGFSQTTIRKNEERTEIRMKEGWNIRTTGERGRAVLLSAQKGGFFILGNDERLTESIRAAKTPPLPRDRSFFPVKAVAGGWLRSDDRTQLLSFLSPSDMKSLLEGLEGDVLWSLRMTPTKVHLVLQYEGFGIRD